VGSAKFEAELVPVPHGGHYVVVPPEAAEKAGLKYGDRVRGTVNKVSYRSSLMKYSGLYHMGVHKAVLEEIGAGTGDKVKVTLEIDDQPLPGDVPPDDLVAAMKRNPLARQGYEALTPAHRREHVKHILEAKKPETRAKRIAQTLVAFVEKGKAVAAKAKRRGP
jgi:hypothetical protein